MGDNHPDDKYFYELVVETGPMASHATSSKINFILSGDEEDTDVRLFNDPERHPPGTPLFKRGGVDAFLMSVPRPLGDLQYLRVWTDSSGLGEMSAWYVLSISVHDVQTGIVTRFVGDQWLALDREPFEDDITLHASAENEELNRGYLLRSAGTNSLANDHLWASIFSRPTRSRFNRKERASVSMSIIYL